MSWPTLDEVPGVWTLAGGAVCLAGVAVSRSRGAAAAPALQQPPRPGPRAPALRSPVRQAAEGLTSPYRFSSRRASDL